MRKLLLTGLLIVLLLEPLCVGNAQADPKFPVASPPVGVPIEDSCVISHVHERLEEDLPAPEIEEIQSPEITAEEVALAQKKFLSFRDRIKACLATPKGQALQTRFKDGMFWKKLGIIMGADLVSLEIADVGLFFAINGVEGYRKNPSALWTDTILDGAWTPPADLMLSVGPILFGGYGRLAALGVNSALGNGVGFPKRLVDKQIYLAELKKNRPDLTDLEREHAASTRLHALLVWQAIPLTAFNLTVFELMTGTSCLIPGSRWVRSLGPKGTFAFRMATQGVLTGAYLGWKKLFIPPLPTKNIKSSD